ncbi:MAG: tetratricopeptide repeat protein [Terriglobia bacterium]
MQRTNSISESHPQPMRSQAGCGPHGRLTTWHGRKEVLRHVLVTEARFNRGSRAAGSCLNKGKCEDALPELRLAVRLSPDSAKYSLGLAQALLLSKAYTEALAFLETVEVRFGKSPEFRYKLALACYYSRLYPKAIVEFETLLSQSAPRLDLAQYYLGNSYQAVGELAKAEACFRKAIEMNPKGVINYLALGALLNKQGIDHADEAILISRKAMELYPADPRPKLLALPSATKRKRIWAKPKACWRKSLAPSQISFRPRGIVANLLPIGEAGGRRPGERNDCPPGGRGTRRNSREQAHPYRKNPLPWSMR